jgi:hypothetical protein
MERVGRTFVFDYGQLTIRVRYASDRKLHWEQVKGPEVGSKAEEEYGSAAIRPGVDFLWWQEKDGAVVSQVVDLEKRRVHTTWVAPGRTLAAFQGTVTAAKER